MSDNQEYFQSWTKTDLLNYQLMRDKKRWKQAFESKAPTWGDHHPAMKLAVLATMVREVKFQDKRIKQYFGNIDSPLIKEAVAITSGYLIHDDNCPQKIQGLEPDLLGEWFVLYCFHKGLEFEELLDIAWQYWPNETANFLQKIVQDFIDLSKKEDSNWGITEKLLTYKPPRENYYQALANVSGYIVYRLFSNKKTIPQNLFDALKHASNSSNTLAMLSLGYFYFFGIGVTRNIKKAIDLFQRAVKKGDSSVAKTMLGICYFSGEGVRQDLDRAFDLFQQAVKQGEGVAMFCLGAFYEAGIVVEQDFKKAFKLYKRAVELGFSIAMGSLGHCYHNGTGVKQDWNKAVSLYQQAIRAGEKWVIKDLDLLLLQNFLGVGNYRAHKINGWLHNKSSHLTATPVFDPPILIGDWKQLTDKELTVCLDKVIASFEILDLVKKLDGYYGQYGRLLPLKFYKDCNLVDIQLYNPSYNNILIFSAIFSCESIMLLNGKRDIIHELNQHVLALDNNKKTTLEYLRFWCSYAQLCDILPAQVVSNLDEIPFDSEADQHLQAEIKTQIFSPRYIEGSFEIEGYQQFEACTLTMDMLLISVYKVFPDGIVSVDSADKESVGEARGFDRLPIFQRQFGNIFRTSLRSRKDFQREPFAFEDL